jgi:hypothetical protein
MVVGLPGIFAMLVPSNFSGFSSSARVSAVKPKMKTKVSKNAEIMELNLNILIFCIYFSFTNTKVLNRKEIVHARIKD